MSLDSYHFDGTFKVMKYRISHEVFEIVNKFAGFLVQLLASYYE